MGKSFAFALGSAVRIKVSGETGIIQGRSEYVEGYPNSYWIRYKSGDGRAVESWWTEQTIELVEPVTYNTTA